MDGETGHGNQQGTREMGHSPSGLIPIRRLSLHPRPGRTSWPPGSLLLANRGQGACPSPSSRLLPLQLRGPGPGPPAEGARSPGLQLPVAPAGPQGPHAQTPARVEAGRVPGPAGHVRRGWAPGEEAHHLVSPGKVDGRLGGKGMGMWSQNHPASGEERLGDPGPWYLESERQRG